ncbi:MAG: ribosomal-protein-alanine N-acetyltransferase [SAR324 cluster bacterium]|uniref:[Ribosomal protein bS18]-alanine N-acetyltransferase n=1 Tax=SAR324 cluster bacterium TaxID=2024889 RepID=A0A2A4TAT2_9DELT|nr:MAG: ribosomal-protein-alanine N-acetyltransferase [SAR324 cluster bacterium]
MILSSWGECLPHLDGICQVEQECFPLSSWKKSTWQGLFENHGLILILEFKEQQLVGFLAFSKLILESELLKVGVLPKYQGQGPAQELLKQMIELLRKSQTEQIFLEVRADNTQAKRFYQRNGFQESGRRKGYYHSPRCDALLYTKNLEQT